MKGQRAEGVFREVWPFMRPDLWAFALALALTPFAALLSLAQPYLLKTAIDNHVVPGLTAGLGTVALLYLAAVLAGYVLEGLYVISLAWGGQRDDSQASFGRVREVAFVEAVFPRRSACGSSSDPGDIRCRLPSARRFRRE